MLPIAPENIIYELICFAAFVSVCIGLLKLRYSKKISALILAGSIAVAAVIQMSILLTAANPVQQMLTLFPITAYLPVIIAVHILAKGGFAAAVAAWSFGLAVPYILNLFRTLMRQLWKTDGGMPVADMRPVVLAALVLAGLLVFAALRFCRKPFQTFRFKNKYVWLIAPVVLIFLLISYFESMTFEPVITVITFLVVLAMFVFLVKFLNIAMSEQIARTSEAAIARQLDVQRQELLRINQKMEQGRIYRHDMRHHLSVLNELAEGAQSEELREYISSLDLRISDMEKERYCDNTVVNAVLSSYIGQAKQKNIRIEAKVNIPKELPLDAFDICTILANALDNAVVACGGQKERWINMALSLHDNGNFSVDIKNPSETPVVFGKDGLPLSRGGERHGIGLKSIDAIVRKYGGIMRCTCEDGIFRLSAVLFAPENIQPAAKSFGVKKAVTNTVTTVLLAVCFLNFLPDTMHAVASVPVLGDMVRLLDIGTYRKYFSWGSSTLQMELPEVEFPVESVTVAEEQPEQAQAASGTDGQEPSEEASPESTAPSAPSASTSSGGGESGITIPSVPAITLPEAPSSSAPSEPEPEPDSQDDPASSAPEEPKPADPQESPSNEILPPDLSPGIEDMNDQMEAYIAEIEEEFYYYFSIKYNGYVASDTGYSILRNDEQMLSIRFYTTVNLGGSAEYSRCFTLDKTSGKVLKLADLFMEQSDYIGAISADILRQMEEQAAAGEGDYFLSGGIWPEEDCFKAIDADQNFYIDKDGKLVILFEEYEVAPGSMGAPQFTVEPEVLQSILRQPSLLSLAGKESE